METEHDHSEIPTNDTDKLIEVLGLTNDIHEAGYILPDGRLLHLDRSNCFKRKNHLDVLKLLPDFLGQEHSIIDTDMIAFMAQEKLIRFCIDGRIHTAVKPTSKQLRKLYTTLAYRSTPFEVMISNAAGMTLAQHTISGPTMGALVDIFSTYDLKEHSDFSEDEFCLQEDKKHYKLFFRPAMKVVGKCNKNSRMIKMDDGFKEANSLFMRLIKQGVIKD
ncbi:hypothetical protein CW745_09020 [Psychromonas sp. psych-6C06]|uniref:hypothetical protein n=1 Tax=Psychromonas sp. psych-6C06 TaxID=2058089 RepID=UPI000C320CD3|nr:hypothetical protein [Psychromonas sp. psych-6C06]PKF61467.1 hypothetical protein CW745_09020 [Psychromonas sp. psych-6C06]